MKSKFWLKGIGGGCALVVVGLLMSVAGLLLSFFNAAKSATSEAQIRNAISSGQGGASDYLSKGGIILFLLGLGFLVVVPILGMVRAAGIGQPKPPTSDDDSSPTS